MKTIEWKTFDNSLILKALTFLRGSITFNDSNNGEQLLSFFYMGVVNYSNSS